MRFNSFMCKVVLDNARLVVHYYKNNHRMECIIFCKSRPFN